MVKKILLTITFLLCLELLCLENTMGDQCPEAQIIQDIKGILRRNSLPEQDFSSWCKTSSVILKSSEKGPFKALGTSLEEIHLNTPNIVSSAALIPKIARYVNSFVDAVKHEEPDFSFSWYETLLVAPHVTPWALKSMQSKKEEVE